MEKDKNNRVRSIDVARLAGVSRSAVSRTFTPNAYVSPETREKVLKASDALGYHPNVLARSLITRRSGIIGVVSTDLDNPFYADILQKISIGLQNEGLASLLLFGDERSTNQQISQLLSYQVDAIMVTNAVLSSELTARLSRVKLPVIAVNRYFPQDWVTSVTCDNKTSATAMADHLVTQGCKRIVFVAGKQDASSNIDRESGFLRGLAERGIAPIALESGDYSHDGGAEAARRLLSSDVRPDGVFCANDMMALGFMDVARTRFGIRIPEDMRIAGFDNSALASWPTYELSSVDQNVDEMVRLAIDEVSRRLAGEDTNSRHIEVQGKLCLRRSTLGS
jgi:DNA-binding LacI/PurR family transcriptional regulator